MIAQIQTIYSIQSKHKRQTTGDYKWRKINKNIHRARCAFSWQGNEVDVCVCVCSAICN